MKIYLMYSNISGQFDTRGNGRTVGFYLFVIRAYTKKIWRVPYYGKIYENI